MSITHVRQEVERFLANTEPEVICISGKWGVGKTYTWNLYLKQAIRNKTIGLARYSYVSLFGHNSMSDVRTAITESIISTTDSARVWEEEHVATFFKKSGFKVWGFASNVLRRLRFLEQYAGGYEHLAFLFVRNQIICIDDLERMGSELRLKDVLGLVTFLKEQRKCKVVILLNRDELQPPDKEDFDAQLEKVADVVMAFQPTPSEASAIALPSSGDLTDTLRKSCVQLGITNIRVIKKIEKQCLRLKEILGVKYPELINPIIQSATMSGWAVHQPKEAPTLEFIRNFNRVSYSFKEKIPEADKEYCAVMEAYNYTHTDELDLVIMEGMQLGYFDVLQLEKAAKTVAEQASGFAKNDSYNKAWNLYHDSFENNEDEVMEAMYNATKESLDILSPHNLQSAVLLLKEFGKEREAKELVVLYADKRKSEKELFDLTNHFAFSELSDPDIINAFKKARGAFLDTRNSADVLEEISKKSGWNPDDVELIEKLDEDGFYTLLKSTRGTKLHHVTRVSMWWLNNPDARLKAIGETAVKALKRISKESKINARRVRRDGITVDELE